MGLSFRDLFLLLRELRVRSSAKMNPSGVIPKR